MTSSKTYSVRLSGLLLTEVEAFMRDHAVGGSTAIARLLLESQRARSNTPHVRWAVVDPESLNYGLALGELRELADTLRRSCGALARPRPVSPEDSKQWAEQTRAANNALNLVALMIRQLQQVGKLALVIPNNIEAEERAFEKAPPGSALKTLLGLILGKNIETPPTREIEPKQPEIAAAKRPQP
jgi:hypothetical protein